MQELTEKSRIKNNPRRILPESPREWDNLGHIVAFHRRYTFPQEGEEKYSNPEEFDAWMKAHKAIVVLPIYMLDHSSIAMQTTPFGGLYGHFDSGQIGYIYATYAQIRKEMRVKKITPEVIEKVKEILRSEIETYSQYVDGNVWGYILGTITKCNHGDEHFDETDSCWGFFGSNPNENGIVDHVGSEWKDAKFEEKDESEVAD